MGACLHPPPPLPPSGPHLSLLPACPAWYTLPSSPPQLGVPGALPNAATSMRRTMALPPLLLSALPPLLLLPVPLLLLLLPPPWRPPRPGALPPAARTAA